MPSIQSVQYRSVFNSHVQLTREYIVTLTDGSVGIGASSQGETVSIYEDRHAVADPAGIVSEIMAQKVIGREIDQTTFDAFLAERFAVFGRNNCYALSEAFFNACCVNESPFDLLKCPSVKPTAPRLCLNILNGGWHAYTNPVLSDFSEYILVARSNDIPETIGAHNEIQRMLKDRLAKQPRMIVNGQMISCFATADNRECLELILDVRGRLGYDQAFDLWIDASAGDLWTDNGYRLALTSRELYTSEQFTQYWLDIIAQYDLHHIEDPFCETDYGSWHDLTALGHGSRVIGDNLYSSNSARIAEGSKKQLTHGVLIKPNQAGTVSEVCNAIVTAQQCGQEVITSHRSISTESTFLSLLTCAFGINFIKIGPLVTDFSSIMRLNEIIRLTGGRDGS